MGSGRKIYHAPNQEKSRELQPELYPLTNKIAGERFAELLETMAQLRGEGGCPWDKQQTHVSLRPFLIEESYELFDALATADASKIREELGDLLHQIVFHCQIAAENGSFTAEEVVSELKEKMVRRHPHVFSGAPASDPNGVLKQWAELKSRERSGDSPKSVLGSLSKAMPALARAQAVTERASHVGFDWPNITGVWAKIEEELRELKAAYASGDKQRTAEELGDLFFTLVNLSRFLGLQAEDVLTRSTERFIRRFTYIEDQLSQGGKTLATSSLDEMERLWKEAKALERRDKARP